MRFVTANDWKLAMRRRATCGHDAAARGDLRTTHRSGTDAAPVQFC